MRETFSARLLALSHTHDQLTRGGWQWADLHALLKDLFAPFEADRIRLDGGPVRLQRSTALTPAMVVHELATNAAKYGALSAPGWDAHCLLEERWQCRQPELDMSWREIGGPKVAALAHKGFGTRLFEHGIEGQLKGRAELHYNVDGVHCRIRVPLSARV